MRKFLCHHLNSMHLYCRLLALHVPKPWAQKIAARWERVSHPFLYN